MLTRVSGLLWLVTIAALVAAALAVAATSAATVIERRSEVGLMKALGATNLMVGRDFFGGAVCVGDYWRSDRILVGVVAGARFGGQRVWYAGEFAFGAFADCFGIGRGDRAYR